MSNEFSFVGCFLALATNASVPCDNQNHSSTYELIGDCVFVCTTSCWIGSWA